MSDIENKLAVARMRLILDQPFLGALEKEQLPQQWRCHLAAARILRGLP